MAEPRISVIMPMRNVNPAPMLDSLFALRIPMQIVAVDDMSTDGTVAIAWAWSRKSGQPVEIVRNERRLYSYGSRLRGMTHAKAPVVWNVDADDLVPPGASVHSALELMEARTPDILHCRAVGRQGDDPLYKSLPWSEPIAAELRGAAVFETFMRLDYPPAILWNKFYSAALCRSLVAMAPEMEIRYFDVKFLGLLALMLSNNYMGCNDLIYEYRMRVRRPAWLYSQQVKSLLLLKNALSPLVERLAPGSLKHFHAFCKQRLVIQAGHLAIMAQKELAGLDYEERAEWLRREIAPNIQLEELASVLKISLESNSRRAKAIVESLGGRICGDGHFQPKNVDSVGQVLEMLAENAAIAQKLTNVMAPGVDITKKAN